MPYVGRHASLGWLLFPRALPLRWRVSSGEVCGNAPSATRDWRPPVPGNEPCLWRHSGRFRLYRNSIPMRRFVGGTGRHREYRDRRLLPLELVDGPDAKSGERLAEGPYLGVVGRDEQHIALLQRMGNALCVPVSGIGAQQVSDQLCHLAGLFRRFA